ncbi:MAG TPA: type II secretion system F family protein [Acidimicrobiia bacterium]|nr:type II secretion system F family protein [Acidimicrobiia bacterium]
MSFGRRALLAGLVAALVIAAPAGAGQGVVIEQVNIDEYPDVSLIVSLPGNASPQELTADDFAVLIEGARLPLDVYGLVRDPMEIVVALDTSGSMAGDPLVKAIEGARGFIVGLPDTVRFGLVSFGDTPTLVAPVGTSREEIDNLLDGLEATGETSLYDAIVTAADAFEPESDARKVIVVLSDGADTVSEATLIDALKAVAEDGIDVRAVALDTSETDHTALGRLSGGSVVTAESTADLASAYEEVAHELTGRFRLSFRTSAEGSSEISVFVQTPIGVLSTNRTVVFPSTPTPVATTLPAPPVTIAPPPAAPAVATPGPFGEDWAMPTGIGLVFLGLLVVLWMQSRGGIREVDAQIRKEKKRVRSGLLARLGVGASAVRDMVVSQPEKGGLDRDLDRAGLDLRSGEFIIIHATVVVISATIGLIFNGAFGAIVLGIVGVAGPRLVLNTMISRRRVAFADQLEGTLQIIAGTLRSGYGLIQAVSTVAAESPSPTSDEFGRVVVENRLGRTVEDAMRAMAARLENEDLEWVVEAIEIQHEVGGNLAEVLDTVTGTIRDRNNIRRQVKALSAEGRISAIILIALPFAVAALITVVTPDYLTELFTTLIGRIMLGFAGVMMLLGTIWIRKLVKVEF